MRSGQCPKCNNQSVYKATEGIGFGSSGKIYVYTSAATRAVPVEDYVCSTCGYFERYIADRDKLDAVAQNWEKVG